MKHSRISLVERAAEIYDFGSALRGRAPADAPAEPASEPPSAPPAAEAPEPAPAADPLVEFDFLVSGPTADEPVVDEPVAAEPPRPTMLALRLARNRQSRFAKVDRDALEAAGHIVPGAPATGLAEEFRLVKRQLLAGLERRISLPEEKRRSVLVCSAQSQEGKTFCAINLALSLAGEQDVEVLLVDADVAKPDLLSALGIENGPGLVDALADPSADPEDFVIRTDVEGLSVLSAGRKTHNVPELMASERTREVLVRLVAADPRRIIIFDSPPALMASPAPVLAGHVGQVLLVVRADRTTEADLRETTGLLAGCDHVGLLLNGAGIAVSGRNYGGYYGYGRAD